MLLSCDAPGLLDVEVYNPHCQMAQEAECAQEAEQEVQEPEDRLAHQLEVLEAVGSLEHQLAQAEQALVAHLHAQVHPSPLQPEKQVLPEYSRAGWELREYQDAQQTREEHPGVHPEDGGD